MLAAAAESEWLRKLMIPVMFSVRGTRERERARNSTLAVQI